MGLLDDVGGILKQYQTGATPAPADVNAHFDQVASAVPASTLADGVAHALSSNQTPPLGQMVSSLFNQADPAQKAAMVNKLLAALPPGTASTAAGGALASILGGGTTVSPQQAQQVTPDAVAQLAQHAQAADGSIVNTLSAFYAQHPTLVKSLGVGALALVMSHMSNRR
jgi:hypothetical protein